MRTFPTMLRRSAVVALKPAISHTVTVRYKPTKVRIYGPNSAPPQEVVMSVPIGLEPSHPSFSHLVNLIPENRRILGESSGGVSGGDYLRNPRDPYAFSKELDKLEANMEKLKQSIMEEEEQRKEWRTEMKDWKRVLAADKAFARFPEASYLMLASVGSRIGKGMVKKQGEFGFTYRQRCVRVALQASEEDIASIPDYQTRQLLPILQTLYDPTPSRQHLLDVYGYYGQTYPPTPDEFAAYINDPEYYGLDKVCPGVLEAIEGGKGGLLVEGWRKVYEEWKVMDEWDDWKDVEWEEEGEGEEASGGEC
ncbi:hypothetical protein IAT38_005491 [Cryptococcus sp. DSM 104549]